MNRQGPLVVGIAFAVLAILAVVLLVLPKAGQVGDTRDELEAAQQQQVSLENQLQSLQQAQQQAPDIRQELSELSTLVPPTADVPGIIRLLADAADRSGIDFFQVAPTSPVADPSLAFSIISTSVTVNGEFFALDEFLFRLEALPRAAKVISFDVAQGPDFADGGADEPFELTILMNVEFYTTDSSAGPASIPGPTEGEGTAPVPGAPLPSPTPSPIPVSPTETVSPTAAASPTDQGA